MILLDTNALIWLLDGSQRLGLSARDMVAARHPVHYSSISVLEMTIKTMKGRLSVREDICSHLDRIGLRQMPLIGEHAEALTGFPELVAHDPFDRALLAQAKAEGLTFLTADRRLLALGLDWIVDAAA
jgi:PIN domain nuclease of toxin-antitoxin system